MHPVKKKLAIFCRFYDFVIFKYKLTLLKKVSNLCFVLSVFFKIFFKLNNFYNFLGIIDIPALRFVAPIFIFLGLIVQFYVFQKQFFIFYVKLIKGNPLNLEIYMQERFFFDFFLTDVKILIAKATSLIVFFLYFVLKWLKLF